MKSPPRPVIDITDNSVRKLRFAPFGYQFYRDARLPGFYVRVGTGVKTFTVQKAIPAAKGGRLVIYSIGRAGDISADAAREKAMELLSRIAGGEDVLATEGRRYVSAAERKAAAAQKVAALPSAAPGDHVGPEQMGRPSCFLAPSKLPSFSALLEALPTSRLRVIAAHLGVTDRAVQNWKTNDCAPRAVMLALYAESNYGRSVMYTSLINEASMYRQLCDSLKREVKRLEAVVAEFQSQGAFETANSPIFGALSKGGPRPIAPPAPKRTRAWGGGS